MNDYTQEKISLAVSNAIADEKLMHKEVAEIFQTDKLYFTYLKNEKYWAKVPIILWESLRNWMYSGQKLKGYKLPKKPADIPRGVADEKLVETYKEQLKPMGPAPDPAEKLRIKSEDKKKGASEGAKEFLRKEKEKKEKAEKRQEKFLEEIADRLSDEISGELEHSPMIAIVEVDERRPESGIVKKFDLEVELRIKLKE